VIYPKLRCLRRDHKPLTAQIAHSGVDSRQSHWHHSVSAENVLNHLN
jgi:hypothetical protein